MNETLDYFEPEPEERVITDNFACRYCGKPIRANLINDTTKSRPLPTSINGRAVNLDRLKREFRAFALKDHIQSGQCEKFIKGPFGIVYPSWMRPNRTSVGR